MLLNKTHPFCDGNGRMCKIVFANDKTKYIDKSKLYIKQYYRIV